MCVCVNRYVCVNPCMCSKVPDIPLDHLVSIVADMNSSNIKYHMHLLRASLPDH